MANHKFWRGEKVLLRPIEQRDLDEPPEEQDSSPCPAVATGDENRPPSHQAILGFSWPLRALV
jgi:hypothetical protein